MGTFEYVDRNNTVYDELFLIALKQEINELGRVELRPAEFNKILKNKWLTRFLPVSYWEWLRQFHFEPQKIQIWLDEQGHLHIRVTDFLYKVTLYEVPILYTVSECYYRYNNLAPNMELMMANLKEKVALANSENLIFS